MEIGNLPRKEFKLMILLMTQDLRKRMASIQEMFTRNLKEVMNKQTERDNILGEINSRITEAEGWISDLEDRMV